MSLAGKQEGMNKGSGTRSGMLWEVERMLDELEDNLPQILLMENVPQIASKKNIDNFNMWINFLETKGYTNKYCMLNAKEIGYPNPVPQNRNRCFMISVLNPIKDITFPPKEELKLKLKDLLEDNVDEKYYLSDEQVARIHNTTFNQAKTRIQENEVSQTLCARDWKDPKCVRVGGIFDNEKSKHQAGSIYDKDGLAPTLDTMSGGWRQPCIEIKEATKQGYKVAYDGDGVNISSRMKYQRGNVQHEMTQTITTTGGNDRGVVIIENKWSDLD